jgi:D-xylonolactonase
LVDITLGTVYQYDPNNRTVEKIVESDFAIGGFTAQEDGSLLLFMEKSAIKIWRNNTMENVVDEIPVLKDTRFNDVIADPAGRVFCGTMPDNKIITYLFVLETNGDIKLILDNVKLSNRMGFTPDKKQMCYTDSLKGKVHIFD